MTGLRGMSESPSPMTRATRREVVGHAVRWATNMLAEVATNHGRSMTVAQRTEIQAALLALGRFTMEPWPGDVE